jgi:hypothetical protein
MLGAIAFAWRVWDTFQNYLHIELSIEKPDAGFALAQTAVENKGASAKRVDYAILLIGLESESPIRTFNALAGIHKLEPIEDTNAIEDRNVQEVFRDEVGRAIIPLPFFYSENVDIADEKVGYTYPLKATLFQPCVPYAVRFFVFGEGRLHRSTQAVVVFQEKQEAEAMTARDRVGK